MNGPWVRWVSAVRERDITEVVAAGGVAAELRGDVVSTKQDLLRQLAESLRFPDYFGMNWDALVDCLDDLGWLGPPSAVLVVLTGTARLKEVLGDDFEVFQEILEEAGESWGDADVAFHSLFAP